MRAGKIFSVSYAYMFEDEEYDSVATFARHSIRPKLKLVLADGAFLWTGVHFISLGSMIPKIIY